MNGKYLLDTSIVIALFSDDDVVKEKLLLADEVFIPNIVIGELIYGAMKSGRSVENMNRVEEFIAENVVIGSNTETARRYGEIKFGLQQRGRSIPENDIWIAALALEHELSLVTRDEHFQEVIELDRVVW